jgi:hypothetical protein
MGLQNRMVFFPDYFGIIVKFPCKWAYSHGDNINLNKFSFEEVHRYSSAVHALNLVQLYYIKDSSLCTSVCVHTPRYCIFGRKEINDMANFSFR